MALSAGRPYVAIPGPSVIPDRVLQAMHRPAPNIYSGPLADMVDGLIPDLKRVARTDGRVAIYAANGHGAWEAALVNAVATGDHVLVLATGHFAPGWGRMAETLGARVEVMDFGRQGAIDPSQVEERLRADNPGTIRAILCVQVDTATGVRNDIKALRGAIDAAGHPALLMVDAIACLASDAMAMDDWGVDVLVAGCQKGLMTPPGLGLVYFNDRGAAARARADRVTPYWDWVPRTEPTQFYELFCGTAPTHHLYGLREALDMLFEEGMDNVLARHATLARAIWAAFDTWATAGGVTVNIADPALRSHAVTALTAPDQMGTRLRDWLVENTGVTLGIGLGMAAPDSVDWHRYFRIGHMGHVNAHMILGALGAIEAGMRALEIPFNPGGLEAAVKVCSTG